MDYCGTHVHLQGLLLSKKVLIPPASVGLGSVDPSLSILLHVPDSLENWNSEQFVSK